MNANPEDTPNKRALPIDLRFPDPPSFRPLNTLVHSRRDTPVVVLYRHPTRVKMKRAFATVSMALAAAVLSEVPGVHADYNLIRAWEGQTFFDGWEFYGYYDNLTNVSPAQCPIGEWH